MPVRISNAGTAIAASGDDARRGAAGGARGRSGGCTTDHGLRPWILFTYGRLPLSAQGPLRATGTGRANGLLRPPRARTVRRGRPRTYTLTQLGQDLETVLQKAAPRGVIVLVGHSMGGMTVLSHARQFPERYGHRIVGAALICSAAEGVVRSPLGEILKNPALEAVRFTARSAPKLMHRGRNVSRSLIGPVLRAASFNDLRVSRSLDAFSQRMMNGTPSPPWWASCAPWKCTTKPLGSGRCADPDPDRVRRPRPAHPG